MNNTINYNNLKSIWEDCYEWTFNLIDFLYTIDCGNGKILNLDEAVSLLLKAQDSSLKKQELITNKMGNMMGCNKAIGNYYNSINRLFKSTKIGSKRKMSKSFSYDFFDLLIKDKINQKEIEYHLPILRKNLENNWVAFNQSYGRVLIKLKLKGYLIN